MWSLERCRSIKKLTEVKACFCLNYLLNICISSLAMAVAAVVVVFHSLHAMLEGVDKTDQGYELLLTN